MPMYAIRHSALLIIRRFPPLGINPIIKYLLNVSVLMSPFLLTQKDVLQKGMLDSQIVNISLHNKSDAVYIYTAQNQILQWSQGKKPCLLIPSIELERPATISFGDWNNDELTDYLTFDSCWYCTSNHLLHLGMN